MDFGLAYCNRVGSVDLLVAANITLYYPIMPSVLLLFLCSRCAHANRHSSNVAADVAVREWR